VTDFRPANFGLPRLFRFRVRSRHGTDRRTNGQTDGHRGPFCNAPFLMGPGHKSEKLSRSRSTWGDANPSARHLIRTTDSWPLHRAVCLFTPRLSLVLTASIHVGWSGWVDLPAGRRLPILLLTGSDVEQPRWSRPTHYRIDVWKPVQSITYEWNYIQEAGNTSVSNIKDTGVDSRLRCVL